MRSPSLSIIIIIIVTLLAVSTEVLRAAERLQLYPSGVQGESEVLSSSSLHSDTTYYWGGTDWIPVQSSEYTFGSSRSEVVTRVYDDPTSTWTDFYRTVTMSSGGLLRSCTSYTWQTSQWVNSELKIHTYSGAWPQDTTELVVRVWSEDEWVNDSRSIRAQLNSDAEQLVTQFWSGSAWSNDTRTTSAWNVIGLDVVVQSWNGSAWINLTYSVDTIREGNVSVKLLRVWDSAAATWVNSAKCETVNDLSNDAFIQVVRVNYDWLGLAWVATDTDTLRHSGGRRIDEVFYDIQLDSLARTIYSYPPNQIVTINQVSNGAEWVNVTREVRDYGVPSAVFEEYGGASTPSSFVVSQNYPNPFNRSTTIPYSLSHDAHVKGTVINLLGGTVAVLVDEHLHAGAHIAIWDGLDSAGREVASGVYFFQFLAPDHMLVKKMVLLK